MVVPQEIEDNEQLHIELRNRFLEQVEKNGNYEEYEESDIEKIRIDDSYCKRFILHKKGNLEEALKMVDEALKWRKSFGVKDVTQESIPIEFFQAKAVFPFNTDKDGNPIILILVRYHRKIPEFIKELRRFVIYWVELMEEQTQGGQMTVIMSCTGAGLSNLDLDLIKFLITLFRSYYPHSLAHILIYEMPWIFNAAWKIIKAWLPEDFVEKIKFVNQTTIRDYVNENSLPLEMGGTDATEYDPPLLINDINSNTIIENANGTEPKKDYHLQKNSKVTSSHVYITDDYAVVGGILKISPGTELDFTPSKGSINDVLIKLSCLSEKAISYKVKTNNIESYRVKPSIGIIEPNNVIEINVALLPGFHPQPTDKFLIMVMEVPDTNFTNLNTLWKTTTSNNIADHKLKCILKKTENSESEIHETLYNINENLKSLEVKISSLHSKHVILQSRQNILLYFITFLIIIVLLQNIINENSLFHAIFKYKI